MSNFPTTNAPEFESRHIGPREQDAHEMLQTIGVSAIEELIQQTIPASIRIQKERVIPAPRTDFA
jgi:glycine dehydrogenase